MSSKRKPAKKPKPRLDEDEGVVIARTVLCPTVQAAVTFKEYGKSYGDLDLLGLAATITEYLNRNPEPSAPGACTYCGRAEDGGCAIVPFLAGDARTWLHQTCWPQWQQDRVNKARQHLLINAIGGQDARN